jgi:large subunit ribosomal protein L2
MGIKKLKPNTPGQRHRIAPDFSDITASKPEKSLTATIKRTGGRNSEGHRTARYIGGGHKRRYRLIDFKRNKVDISAEVKTIEYDPNRTARIALVEYTDGEKAYIIAPNGLKVGQAII